MIYVLVLKNYGMYLVDNTAIYINENAFVVHEVSAILSGQEVFQTS